MAAEKANIRTAATTQGTAKAISAPNARQTYVSVRTRAAGQSATYPGRIQAVIAPNARQTHFA